MNDVQQRRDEFHLHRGELEDHGRADELVRAVGRGICVADFATTIDDLDSDEAAEAVGDKAVLHDSLLIDFAATLAAPREPRLPVPAVKLLNQAG
jgi:hypothetical protein